MKTTHTFAILEVAKTTYDDVRKRLVEWDDPMMRRDYECEYLTVDDGKEYIVLGTIALVAAEAATS